MPLHSFGDLLGTSEALKALTARVRRLKELQSLYVRTAPRELASSSRVKGCRAGTLFVFADNAAVAAKLKQLAPRLLAAIRQNEGEINQIRIEVQVAGRSGAGAYIQRKKPLSAATVQRFDALARSMPDGDLKRAIARFSARHASDEHEALENEKDHRDDRHDESELNGAPRPREVAPVAGVEEKRHAKRHRQ
jgi:hypothetical protein